MANMTELRKSEIDRLNELAATLHNAQMELATLAYMSQTLNPVAVETLQAIVAGFDRAQHSVKDAAEIA